MTKSNSALSSERVTLLNDDESIHQKVQAGRCLATLTSHKSDFLRFGMFQTYSNLRLEFRSLY